jgi:hypothetical protein
MAQMSIDNLFLDEEYIVNRFKRLLEERVFFNTIPYTEEQPLQTDEGKAPYGLGYGILPEIRDQITGVVKEETLIENQLAKIIATLPEYIKTNWSGGIYKYHVGFKKESFCPVKILYLTVVVHMSAIK